MASARVSTTRVFSNDYNESSLVNPRLQHPTNTMTHLDRFHYVLDTMTHYKRRMYPSTFTRDGDTHTFITMSATLPDDRLTLHRLNADLSINELCTFDYFPISQVVSDISNLAATQFKTMFNQFVDKSSISQ